MAMPIILPGIGVDASKDWVDVSQVGRVTRFANTVDALEEFLRGLAGPCRFAVEPTNTYHRLLVQLAMAAGHEVYLVDPYRLSRYREALGIRIKADAHDAYLLERYLQAEGRHLKPYQPCPARLQQAKDLLRARAAIVKSRNALHQSLAGITGLARTRNSLLAKFNASIAVLERKLERLISNTYKADYQHCQSVIGLGPLNAAALVATYHRGHFTKSSSFIAYLGLDVRIRESGRYKGQRKLTKKGNGEIRRLLFNAARAAARTSYWKPYYNSLRNRGLSDIQACCALARKLASVAFALMRDGTSFQPDWKNRAC